MRMQISPANRNYLLVPKERIPFRMEMPVFTKEQAAFIFSPVRNSLFSGGRGAGKTFASVWRNTILGINMPGTTHLHGAFTYRMIKDFILPEYEKWLDRFPKGSYTLFKGDMEIEINKSIIRLRSFDDYEKLKGPNYTSVTIGEATSGIHYNAFDALAGTLRESKHGFLNADCNPTGKSHFIYQYWYECKDFEQAKRLHVDASTFSNKNNLPAEYIEDLESRSESWKRRFVMGEWGTMEGQIYKDFDPKIHCQRFDIYKIAQDKEKNIGLDFGFAKPFAGLLIAVDYNKERIWVLKEHYQKEWKIGRHIEYLEHEFMPFKPKCIIPDIEVTGAREEIQEKLKIGIRHPSKGPGSVEAGIYRIMDFLEMRSDGEPGLIIHESCINLKREFESYQRKISRDGTDESEEPIKMNDHALDALRYLVYTLFPPRESRMKKRLAEKQMMIAN